MKEHNDDSVAIGLDSTGISDLSLRLFDTKEVEKRLGLSRSRIYELMASGELPSVKIGRSRRVPARDLAGYIERLRRDH